MKLYDSLTTQIKNVDSPTVYIYNCGPTVYDYIHIGNARPLIMVDIIVRFLEYSKINYKYLINITDIDDKIINKAIEKSISEEEYAKEFTKAFLEDIKKLNIKNPTSIIPISNKINEIIDFIDDLLQKGFAYEVNGNVYFNTCLWKNKYGKLSKQNIEQLNDGERVEIDKNKKNQNDFLLWKKTKIGKKWHSKWSLGRPGWHTECALLIDNFFKSTIDIHAGGIDLKFPHHENERIQYIAQSLQEITKIWLHNGQLSIDNVKMSKSLNNIITVRNFIKNYGSKTLRYIFLATKYSYPLNISDAIIKNAEDWVKKVNDLIKKINWMIAIGEIISTNQTPIDEDFNSYKYMTRFRNYMENDLNTPMIISLLDEMIKNINIQISKNFIDKTFEKLISILNILGFNFVIKKLSNQDIENLKKWQLLKKNKDYEKADILRNKLQKENII